MKFKNQKELFNYIWETREHVSELSGTPLLPKSHFQWHWQFLHVLPKGTYKKWELNPDNILLGTPDDHNNQESFPKFVELKEKLRREYYKEFYNKEFD